MSFAIARASLGPRALAVNGSCETANQLPSKPTAWLLWSLVLDPRSAGARDNTAGRGAATALRATHQHGGQVSHRYKGLVASARAAFAGLAAVVLLTGMGPRAA